MDNFNLDDLDLEGVCQLPRLEYSDRSHAPKKPGVYFILIEAPELKIIYVGKAFSLWSRLTSHTRAQEFEYLVFLGIPVYAAWLQIDPETHDIDTIEDRLISRFKPPLNRYIPSERRQGQIALTAEHRRIKTGGRPATKKDGGKLFSPTDDCLKQEVFDSMEYLLEDLSIRQLREIAMDLRVLNYSRLTAVRMISVIKLAFGDVYQESRLERKEKKERRRPRKRRE